MLISSGRFADYRSETHVFNLLGPKFSDLTNPAQREKLLDVWLQSFQFRQSGLDAKQFMDRTRNGFTTPGEFLRTFMKQICEAQGVKRWAECTPEHLLYMRQIKREIPDAKVIHIIRDGRDVALSEIRCGWVKPFSWDSTHQLAVSGLYWKWIVGRGRKQGREIAPDYMEVRFEELVENPRSVLSRIGSFIDQTLDYKSLLKNAVGTIKEPNTSFDETDKAFSPVGRWKTELEPQELQELESAIHPLPAQLGYQTYSKCYANNYSMRRLRMCYPLYFTSRLWLKSHTPLGRLANIGLLYNPESSAVREIPTRPLADSASAAAVADKPPNR